MYVAALLLCLGVFVCTGAIWLIALGIALTVAILLTGFFLQDYLHRLSYLFERLGITKKVAFLTVLGLVAFIVFWIFR